MNCMVADMGNRQYTMLNRDQKEIVNKILRVSNFIDYNSSRCFYIDGPGESGKTFVYTTLYNLLKSQNKKFCCMAFLESLQRYYLKEWRFIKY